MKLVIWIMLGCVLIPMGPLGWGLFMLITCISKKED